jgi:hypothetical protein
MNRPFALLAATAIAASTIAVAPSAVAYDKDAYAFAASHMLESKKIPKALGTYRPAMDFNASGDRPVMFLCDLEDGNVLVRGAKFAFSANYNTTVKRSPRQVSINVYQFGSSKAAIAGFRTVERQAKRCTGSQSQSNTDDDGVTFSWTSNLQNGKVKDVKVAGVESVFINSDYENGSTDSDRKFLSDSYAVYTLVNNAIIVSQFNNNNENTLTAAERKGANQLAFNAVTAWVG